MSYKIMIVDDEPANLRLLERLFRKNYQTITAGSGAEALRLLEQHEVALIITDQRMPGMTGIELLKRTAIMRPHLVRIILTGYTDVTALVEAINCGQVYKYITKPWNNDDLRLTVSRALEHYDTNKSRHELALTNHRLVSRMQEMTRGFVRAITDALEAKDEHIVGHARRVRGYATAIGRRMELNSETLEQLSLAAFLHDIGKIGTPDSILLKPELLTPEEFAQVRLHPMRGSRMLTGLGDLENVAEAVLHHHEHYDGTGYPKHLSGEQIPLLSRIILVADAYDAMTSPRPFRDAFSHEEAIAILEKSAGQQFDPHIVQIFCQFEGLAKIRHHIKTGLNFAQMFTPLVSFDPRALSSYEMLEMVESEPVLAACVLRETNLANETDVPTAKLSTACAVLGVARLREMMAEADGGSELDPSDEKLWEHSLRCAEAARLLAERTGIINPEDAYTLGLLHDIGEILLRSLFPEEMRAMTDLTDEERTEGEIAAFGVDHAQVGQWVMNACGLPRALTSAVQTHHDVMRINAPAALLLHVANAIADADDPYKIAALDTIGTDRLYMMNLSRNDLFSIYEATGSALERRLDPVL